MTEMTINDLKLHKIEMAMEPYPNQKNTANYLLYPEHRVKTSYEGSQLIVQMPGFLALELYRRATLPQNPVDSVAISLDGKDAGRFVVVDLREGWTSQDWLRH